MLKKNYFPTNLVGKCIKIFLNKQFSQKILEHTVSKKELFMVLQYIGMSSLCLRTRLQIATFHFLKLKSFLNHQDD